MISNIANFLYESPQELLSDLKLRISENQNIIKYFRIRWEHRLVSSHYFWNQFLALVVKTYAKWGFKVFWPCPILLDFFSKYFSQDSRMNATHMNSNFIYWKPAPGESSSSISEELYISLLMKLIHLFFLCTYIVLQLTLGNSFS